MDAAISRLARNIKRGGTSTAWVPRDQRVSMHLGQIGNVDLYNGIVDFEYNDPSGLVIPGVTFLQTYSASNPPAEGHTVWLQHFGTDVMVMGQQVNPTNIVIPS
jgi:hypothetical protein